MRLDSRLDYLDLQIVTPRRGEASWTDKDPDGLPYLVKMLTYDGLAVEFFLHMGLSWESKNRGHTRKYYFTKDKSIFWARERDVQASLQLKGSFFLRSDYKDLLLKIVTFFKQREISFHPSRTDLGILFTVDDEQQFYKSLMRTNWGDLECFLRMKKKLGRGFEAFHSRLEVDFYGKKRQVQEAKKDDPNYVDRIKAVLGVRELPDNLMKVDIRLRQKDQNTAITELLLADEIDFQAMEEAIVAKCLDRVRFSQGIKNILGLVKSSQKKLHLKNGGNKNETVGT